MLPVFIGPPMVDLAVKYIILWLLNLRPFVVLDSGIFFFFSDFLLSHFQEIIS